MCFFSRLGISASSFSAANNSFLSCPWLGDFHGSSELTQFLYLFMIVLICNLVEKGEISHWWEESKKQLAVGVWCSLPEET